MWIKGVKYQQKLQKKAFFTPKTKTWTFDKKEINIPSFLKGSSSKDKKCAKIRKQKIWKIFFVKKFIESYKNDLDPDFDSDPFFPVWIKDPDPHQN